MNGILMKTARPTIIYNAFDVVLVPFPFIDVAEHKKRPAVVISSASHFNNSAEASVLAMITTAQHTHWPLDIEIEDLRSAGLPVPSMVRMKLFTLDHRLILRKLGKLNTIDRKSLLNSLSSLLP